MIRNDTTSSQPPTQWWHPIEDEKVVCTLCPRECHIPKNSRGFCFVRANVNGKLELTTFGRSTGFCVDPIEKKPLNHFLPGTPVLSFGTAGCNLGCKFCQNWDISKSREIEKLSQFAGPDAIVQAAIDSGSRSIAFTYNDPAIWAEYAIAVAKVARQRNIKTVAVTAGYMNPESRCEFYQWMDAANVDLKAFTDSFYRRLTQTSLQPVLDTLVYLVKETKVWTEITTLLIPGENDSPDEISAMCDWIVKNLGPDVPLHFTAFHPDFKMLATPATPHETLIRARQQALDAGIHYVYVGNVNDVQRQSTYCHNCNTLLIERNWYNLGVYSLIRQNHCPQCNATIPGHFEPKPGNWGSKRLPIKITDTAPQIPTIQGSPIMIRPAARAGMFYPSDPAEIQQEIQTYLQAGGLGRVPQKNYRAIMLPHAGWKYCGSTIGKTLAYATIPQTVIILSPRHTPYGANWSVANHTAWQIPGSPRPTIPLDTQLVSRIAKVTGMQCEAEAHAQEHGVEVLLPFLQHLQPNLKIVPIVLGRCTFDATAPLAQTLAQILADAQHSHTPPPLLVISSDLNHFANEPQNRKLDQLALQTMATGNPRKLFDTCVQHDISMCGLMCAVTVMRALQILTPQIAPRIIDYTNSGQTSGDLSRVVGYGGAVIE